MDDIVSPAIRALIDERIEAAHRKFLEDKPWKQNLYLPPRDLFQLPADAPFLQYSTCSTADFFHPRFTEISAILSIPPVFHRKYWEWVLIIDTALKHGLGPGKRALGFGVGAEPLSSAFATFGATVVGTDAPPEIGIGMGWASDNVSFADSSEKLFIPEIVSREIFERNVSFAVCDMNDIDEKQFSDFDFCWSSCCLEHLGSLKHGLDFIIYSVEKTLKVGGVACHTTEFNLSSNNETVEDGHTVLYRKRDLDWLVGELRSRGHKVGDITIAPHTSHLDNYVDTPPFEAKPHLRLNLSGYACTSVAMTITRGR